MITVKFLLKYKRDDHRNTYKSGKHHSFYYLMSLNNKFPLKTI